MKQLGPNHYPAEAVGLLTPTINATGRTFARINGTWHAQTQAGTWRPAAWLIRQLPDQLLDHLLEQQTAHVSPPLASAAAHPGKTGTNRLPNRSGRHEGRDQHHQETA